MLAAGTVFLGLAVFFVIHAHGFPLYPNETLSEYPKVAGILERRAIEEFQGRRRLFTRLPYFESAIYLSGQSRYFVREPIRDDAMQALRSVRDGEPVEIWHLPNPELDRGHRIVHLQSGGKVVYSLEVVLDQQRARTQLVDGISVAFTLLGIGFVVGGLRGARGAA